MLIIFRTSGPDVMSGRALVLNDFVNFIEAGIKKKMPSDIYSLLKANFRKILKTKNWSGIENLSLKRGIPVLNNLKSMQSQVIYIRFALIQGIL